MMIELVGWKTEIVFLVLHIGMPKKLLKDRCVVKLVIWNDKLQKKKLNYKVENKLKELQEVIIQAAYPHCVQGCLI